jgi:hypothetical protein
MVTYVKGDATSPVGPGVKLLCHIVNNRGAWGAGFVLALSKKWKEPELIYRMSPKLKLGDVQIISVEDKIIVVNMIAQTLLRVPNHFNKIPLDYDALRKCLMAVNKIAVEYKLTVHGPRFGSGLAGGNWKVIEGMINEIILVPVYIYDLK